MKKFIAICSLFICAGNLFAQNVLFSKDVRIRFSAKTALENVEAINNKASSVWSLATGQLEFSVLIKGFEFEKAAMQEHFNENYLESDVYPKAVFKGKMEDPGVTRSTGSFRTPVTGTLTIHGVSNTISTTAIITVAGGKTSAVADFSIAAPDYKIRIPGIVADKINKKISIHVYVPDYQNLK